MENKKGLGTDVLASRLYGPEDLRLDTVDKPKIGSDDILLEVKAASLCGTDTLIFHEGARVHPLITGHEYAGVVSKVGKNIKEFEVGDRVVGSWGVSCGKCWYCRNGSPNLCLPLKAFGITDIDGCHAEYMRVPLAERVITKLPDDITFEEGTLISCSLPTGLYGVIRAQIGVGDTVAVFGLGAVGMSAIVASRLAGASYIVAFDPVKYRRELSLKFGADTSLNVDELDEIETIVEVAEKGGVDRSLVTTSAPTAVGQAIDITRRGGRIAVVGSVQEASVNFSRLHVSEMDISGVLGMIGPDFIKKVVTLVENRKIDMERYRSLITHRFRLTEIRKAYELVQKKKKKVLKIVILP